MLKKILIKKIVMPRQFMKNIDRSVGVQILKKKNYAIEIVNRAAEIMEAALDNTDFRKI